MQNDLIDRTDLSRLADDGCPHAADQPGAPYDPAEVGAVFGKDDRPTA